MRIIPFWATILAIAPMTISPVTAQTIAAPATASPYAEIAALVIASPTIIDATIRSATRIKGADAAAVPPGVTRFYVEADVMALIRGPAASPPRIGYLLDVAADATGRLPKLKKVRVLLFARAVGGSAMQVQLVGPDAQRPWFPADDALVRRIVADVVARDAPPEITGVTSAFHVQGSLPGEGETQIFLGTADRRPVSLSILRRPGEARRWAVALSEIVDDAAAPPNRDTLLWYRLACGLPPALPEATTATLEATDAEQARADYAFVLEQLGPCRRSIAS